MLIGHLSPERQDPFSLCRELFGQARVPRHFFFKDPIHGAERRPMGAPCLRRIRIGHASEPAQRFDASPVFLESHGFGLRHDFLMLHQPLKIPPDAGNRIVIPLKRLVGMLQSCALEGLRDRPAFFQTADDFLIVGRLFRRPRREYCPHFFRTLQVFVEHVFHTISHKSNGCILPWVDASADLI